jgi:hypothetical protein
LWNNDNLSEIIVTPDGRGRRENDQIDKDTNLVYDAGWTQEVKHSGHGGAGLVPLHQVLPYSISVIENRT